MLGVIFFMLVTLGISIFCWRLVFNESARQKTLAARWSFFRLNKEQKEMDDAMSLAALLTAAIVSTFIFVSIIILSIIELISPS